MSIEQKLKDLILSNYSSVREFSRMIDMPYSTLDSIFKRGIENASVSNIIRICTELSISVDELAHGNITIRSATNAISKDSTPSISPDAIDLAHKYDQLDTHSQQVVTAVVDMELKRPVLNYNQLITESSLLTTEASCPSATAE